MKTLLPLVALLSSAQSFAMTPSQLNQTMNDVAVQETLKGVYLKNVSDAPSARCAGCFAIRFDAVESDGQASVYEAHGMDFGGRFRVSLSKME
jgi:hypothetical protein